MIKFTYRFGDEMKKYFTILLCLLSVFFLFSIDAKALSLSDFGVDATGHKLMECKYGDHTALVDKTDGKVYWKIKYDYTTYYCNNGLNGTVYFSSSNASFQKFSSVCPSGTIEISGGEENGFFIKFVDDESSSSNNSQHSTPSLECTFDTSEGKITATVDNNNSKVYWYAGDSKCSEIIGNSVKFADFKNGCDPLYQVGLKVIRDEDDNTCTIGFYNNQGELVADPSSGSDESIFDVSNNGQAPSVPSLDIYDESMTCAEIFGPNGVKVVKLGINILRVAGAIIALVNAMLSLLPAVMSKDADALKKAGSKCVSMAIILALIFLFPTLLKIIGKMFEWDVSCLM